MVPTRSALGRRVGVGRTAEIFEWKGGCILKLFLDGFRRESVEQEAKIGRLVSESSLPVPEVKARALTHFNEPSLGFPSSFHVNPHFFANFLITDFFVDFDGWTIV